MTKNSTEPNRTAAHVTSRQRSGQSKHIFEADPQPTHNRAWLRAYDVMRERKQKKNTADS